MNLAWPTRRILVLRAYRANRPAGPAAEALKNLQSGARGTANLMALILAAVRASCTLGEISDALRAVFGEYKEAGI